MSPKALNPASTANNTDAADSNNVSMGIRNAEYPSSDDDFWYGKTGCWNSKTWFNLCQNVSN